MEPSKPPPSPTPPNEAANGTTVNQGDLLRKKFNFRNLNESVIEPRFTNTFANPITAGGCLFYKVESNKLKVLLISYYDAEWSDILDDLGGKTELTDRTIFQTISREVEEESNSVITGDFLLNSLISGNGASSPVYNSTVNVERFYTPRCKYLCLLINVPPDSWPDPLVFGDHEIAEGHLRTISWHEWNHETAKKLNPRLKENKYLIDYLYSLSSKIHNHLLKPPREPKRSEPKRRQRTRQRRKEGPKSKPDGA